MSERPDIRRGNPLYRQRILEIVRNYNPVRHVTERGPDFYRNLRTFEDRMQPGQTVAVFNYGSNNLRDLQRLFSENGVSQDFGILGKTELSGMDIRFGSMSMARRCPVATLVENAEANVPGYISLVSKDQFELIAKKECGPSLGRDPKKGRYRRAVIYFDDPADERSETQAITFVLRDGHEDLLTHPIRSQRDIVPDPNFRSYLELIQKQRDQVDKLQHSDLSDGPAIQAHWNSRSHRS